MIKIEQEQIESATTIEIVVLIRDLLFHLKDQRLEQFAPWAKKEIVRSHDQMEALYNLR